MKEYNSLQRLKLNFFIDQQENKHIFFKIKIAKNKQLLSSPMNCDYPLKIMLDWSY